MTDRASVMRGCDDYTGVIPSGSAPPPAPGAVAVSSWSRFWVDAYLDGHVGAVVEDGIDGSPLVIARPTD